MEISYGILTVLGLYLSYLFAETGRFGIDKKYFRFLCLCLYLSGLLFFGIDVFLQINFQSGNLDSKEIVNLQFFLVTLLLPIFFYLVLRVFTRGWLNYQLAFQVFTRGWLNYQRARLKIKMLKNAYYQPGRKTGLSISISKYLNLLEKAINAWSCRRRTTRKYRYLTTSDFKGNSLVTLCPNCEVNISLQADGNNYFSTTCDYCRCQLEVRGNKLIARGPEVAMIVLINNRYKIKIAKALYQKSSLYRLIDNFKQSDQFLGQARRLIEEVEECDQLSNNKDKRDCLEIKIWILLRQAEITFCLGCYQEAQAYLLKACDQYFEKRLFPKKESFEIKKEIKALKKFRLEVLNV